MIRMETPRLTIREHTEGDLADYHRILTDPVAMFWLPGLRSGGEEETRARLMKVISEQRDPHRTRWFFRIEETESGRYIGEIGYSAVQEGPDGTVVDLGYFILPAFWRRGIAAEAATRVIRYAFEQGRVEVVTAACFAENAGSERVMRRCGMSEDAGCRHMEPFNGENRLRIGYRLTRSDWLRQQARADAERL